MITEQVGMRNDTEFNEALGVASTDLGGLESLAEALAVIEAAGLVVTRAEEAWPRMDFLDVGTAVLQLRTVPWQVPGFDAARNREVLYRIHQMITSEGAFTVTSYRLLLMARRD